MSRADEARRDFWLGADEARPRFHRHVPNDGIGYYFAGYRQGEGNTHISMLNEARLYDWAPTRRKSPLHQYFPSITDMATYYRDRVSAKQSHPYFFYAPYIVYGQ